MVNTLGHEEKTILNPYNLILMYRLNRVSKIICCYSVDGEVNERLKMSPTKIPITPTNTAN